MIREKWVNGEHVRYLCQIHGVLSTLDTNPCSRAKFGFLVLDLEHVSHFFDGDQGEFGGKDIVQSIQSLLQEQDGSVSLGSLKSMSVNNQDIPLERWLDACTRCTHIL